MQHVLFIVLLYNEQHVLYRQRLRVAANCDTVGPSYNLTSTLRIRRHASSSYSVGR